MTTTALLGQSCSLNGTKCFQARRARAPGHAGRVIAASASKQEPQHTSRREAVGVLASVAALLSAAPAGAFLGIGEGQEKLDTYTEDTKAILGEVKQYLDLPKDAANREEFVLNLRNSINSWVAKYRRSDFTGKQSFGNTYTTLNALAGHFNSFGNSQPLPKKRFERAVKEVGDAEKQLTRGR
jgi:photosystem II Psb27 protein